MLEQHISPVTRFNFYLSLMLEESQILLIIEAFEVHASALNYQSTKL